MPSSPKKRAPRETKSEHTRKLAEGQFWWTRLGAIFAGLAVVVAIAIAIAASSTSKPSAPVGIAVNTVPQDPIGGAAVYPVPGGRPSDYLAGGVTLHIDCLQAVKPNYLLARISDGPYTDHWIDVFDVKTPDGQDVRFLRPAFRTCGPAITLPQSSTTTR